MGSAIFVAAVIGAWVVLMSLHMRHVTRKADNAHALMSAKAAAEHEHGLTALERVARTDRGPTRALPVAESAYVLGESDDVWTAGCMEADDRLRRWNGARPRRPARSVRRD